MPNRLWWPLDISARRRDGVRYRYMQVRPRGGSRHPTGVTAVLPPGRFMFRFRDVKWLTRIHLLGLSWRGRGWPKQVPRDLREVIAQQVDRVRLTTWD